MYGIFTNIYHQNDPVLLVNIPAPWSTFDSYNALLPGDYTPIYNRGVLHAPVQSFQGQVCRQTTAVQSLGLGKDMKTMGKLWENGGLVGFDGIFPLVMCYIAVENHHV